MSLLIAINYLDIIYVHATVIEKISANDYNDRAFFFLLIFLSNIAPVDQCDQMGRFFIIRPFWTICPIALKFANVGRLKILSDTEQTLKTLPKIIKICI